MYVKFRCFACGSHQFHSARLNRDLQVARLIGTVIDGKGIESPCIADMGFGGTLPFAPASMEEVWLDVSEVATKNAMLQLTFSNVEKDVAADKSRESKR